MILSAVIGVATAIVVAMVIADLTARRAGRAEIDQSDRHAGGPASVSLSEWNGAGVRLPGLSIRGISRDFDFAQVVSLVALVGVTAWFYFPDLASNPPGFFADEAEIGWEAAGVFSGRTEFTFSFLFYQHFGHEFLGALPILTTAPVTELLGVSDANVRLSSALWSVIAMAAVYLSLRELRIPVAVAPVLAVALSPVVIHMSRVQFGHSASLAFMALSFWLWTRGRLDQHFWVSASAGLLAGVAMYGHLSFVVAVPLMVASICLTEVYYNRSNLRAYIPVVGFGLSAMLAALPIAWLAITRDSFWDRYREKGGATSGNGFGIEERLSRYPNYFSYDYLFRSGEDRVISRHTVPGAGLLQPYLLAFLAIGILGFLLYRSLPERRFFVPWFALLTLYPVVDLVSSRSDPVPYTFSGYWAVIGIPFVIAYGLVWVRSLSSRWGRQWIVPLLASVLMVVATWSGFRFLNNEYVENRAVAADYWGWQYGPRPAISYFLDHPAEYDEFLLDGDFNSAYVMLQFYIEDEELRSRTRIGGLADYDPSRRQLFAVRADIFDREFATFRQIVPGMQVVDLIRYPNGEIALYLLAEAR